MNTLAIIGSRDLGQLIAHHALASLRFDSVVFFDDFRTKGTITQHGPVLGKIEDFPSECRNNNVKAFLIGIGYDHLLFRAQCYERLRTYAQPAQLIHPSCYVDHSARIEDGCVLFPGCVIDAGVTIHQNTLLNTACVIAHDTTIGTNCFLGPGVNLTGYITIEANCFIGAGTTVVDKLKVCSGTQTGAGTVLTKPTTKPGLYVGVPAVKKR